MVTAQLEFELRDQSDRLANLLRNHRGRVIIYTGAGVSTSAAIPDYRGTNGLYRGQEQSTFLLFLTSLIPFLKEKKGAKRKSIQLRLPEASKASPTYTHMAIAQLITQGYVSCCWSIHFFVKGSTSRFTKRRRPSFTKRCTERKTVRVARESFY